MTLNNEHASNEIQHQLHCVCTRSPLPTLAREIGAFVVHTSLRKHQIPNTLTLQPHALAFINNLSLSLRAASRSRKKQVR